MAKTVVILGGSYAGLHVAHYLLKQKTKDVKIILVSKVSWQQSYPRRLQNHEELNLNSREALAQRTGD